MEISDKLKKEQIEELKSYYRTYHKKCWGYKQATKRFKKVKLIGNSLSILFASGGLVSSLVTGGVALVAVSAGALLIQGWMRHQSLDLTIQTCSYAYQSYQHLLIHMKDILRSGNYDAANLHQMMRYYDDFIVDNTPVIDKFLAKYDEKFTH